METRMPLPGVCSGSGILAHRPEAEMSIATAARETSRHLAIFYLRREWTSRTVMFSATSSINFILRDLRQLRKDRK
jgi:hypothetical protein